MDSPVPVPAQDPAPPPAGAPAEGAAGEQAEVAPVNAGAGRQPLLRGKRALITGASRGIGLAVAQAFAREEAHLVLSGRSTESLVQAAKACTGLGAGSVHVIPADLSKHEDVEQLAATCLREYGHVDVIINNAGSSPRLIGSGEDVVLDDPTAWHSTLALNLMAPMTLTRRLTPYMVERKWGLIVNISSVTGIEANAGSPVYCASKFGLRGWSHACYQQLREHGIKVVCVCPGFVATDMTQQVKGKREHMIKPEDVAEAALLALRTSPHATPQEIVLRPTLPVKT